MLQHWSNGQYHETPLGDFSVNHGQGLILLRLHQVVRASVSACVCSRALSVDHTHRPLLCPPHMQLLRLVLQDNRRAVHAIRYLAGNLISIAARRKGGSKLAPAGQPKLLPLTANLSAPAIVGVLQDSNLPMAIRSMYVQWWLTLYRHRMANHTQFNTTVVLPGEDTITKLLQPCWRLPNRDHCTQAHPKCLLAFVLLELQSGWQHGGWSTALDKPPRPPTKPQVRQRCGCAVYAVVAGADLLVSQPQSTTSQSAANVQLGDYMADGTLCVVWLTRWLL